MHIADVERGNLGATGIVGGNIPVATGAALAQKMQGTDRVVLCFFGEGAANGGNFHESLNLAGLWRLPVVYIVENNLYAMSVPIESAAAKLDIADRACAYAMGGEVVDGMNVLAVREAVQRAVDKARRGEGPTLIECKTYRWYGHSRSDPRKYRAKEEEAAWKSRDPIPVFADWLVDKGVCTQDEVEQIQANAERAIDIASDFALSSAFPSPASSSALFMPHPGGQRMIVRTNAGCGRGAARVHQEPAECLSVRRFRKPRQRRCDVIRTCSLWVKT